MQFLQAYKVSARALPKSYLLGFQQARSAHVIAAPPSIKLYQYAICPFCSKVKALLNYAGTDHELVEVNPLTKAEIKWSKDYRKVPIATINDVPFLGSDDIIRGILKQPAVTAHLESQWKAAAGATGGNAIMTLTDFAESESAKYWIQYANDDLASLLYPNICRTLGDSYVAFGYVQTVDAFSPMQRVAIRSLGSLAMYFAASKVKKKRNITDERQALDDALTVLESAKGLGNNIFLSGKEEPHLGDIAVFGTLRAIEGLRTHDEAVHNRGGMIPGWYEKMTARMQQQQK